VLTKIFLSRLAICIYLKQTASTSEPTKELVKKELLVFRRYQLDIKDIKCLFHWWKKHEAMFHAVEFLAQ
jgi:hypothetical protein